MTELAKLETAPVSIATEPKPANPRLWAIAELFRDRAAADFVLQLDPRDLEVTKMFLSLLSELEASYRAELGREMTTEERAYALERLMKDSDARPHIVRLYQERKLTPRPKALTSGSK